MTPSHLQSEATDDSLSCQHLNMCVGLVVTVPSVKTWAPTPARTMGSPRLSGKANSANVFDSYTQHVLLS